MAKETVYNNTLVSGAADETLTYTRYVKDESSGKSTKELLDEKVNKTDQLGTTQIADKAVTTEKLENESVTTDKLDAASVTTDKVADANITTSKLADSSVETEKINNKAVTTDKLNDGAVDNSKLSPNAVTSEKIKNESVITEKLNDRAVTTEKVEEKAITNTKIGDSAVDGRTISEASVEKKHLANDSVATEKLQDSAITSDKIHTDAVTEEKIKDSSVSNSKLADNSVGTSKIKDGNITNEKVANNTLTQDKLDPELRKAIQAATGLPENLVEVIQDVDKEVKTLHSKDTDLQSQITDKQQQITAHDKDIELLQTRSTQMEKTINNIAATGGASVANTVAYTNTTSGLESVNAQGAIDELAAKNKLQDATISAKANAEDVSSQMQTEQKRVNTELAKKFDKESIFQESGDAEDKVMSQKAVSAKLNDLSKNKADRQIINITDPLDSKKYIDVTFTIRKGRRYKFTNHNSEYSNAVYLFTENKVDSNYFIARLPANESIILTAIHDSNMVRLYSTNITIEDVADKYIDSLYVDSAFNLASDWKYQVFCYQDVFKSALLQLEVESEYLYKDIFVSGFNVVQSPKYIIFSTMENDVKQEFGRCIFYTGIPSNGIVWLPIYDSSGTNDIGRVLVNTEKLLELSKVEECFYLDGSSNVNCTFANSGVKKNRVNLFYDKEIVKELQEKSLYVNGAISNISHSIVKNNYRYFLSALIRLETFTNIAEKLCVTAFDWYSKNVSIRIKKVNSDGSFGDDVFYFNSTISEIQEEVVSSSYKWLYSNGNRLLVDLYYLYKITKIENCRYTHGVSGVVCTYENSGIKPDRIGLYIITKDSDEQFEKDKNESLFINSAFDTIGNQTIYKNRQLFFQAIKQVRLVNFSDDFNYMIPNFNFDKDAKNKYLYIRKIDKNGNNLGIIARFFGSVPELNDESTAVGLKWLTLHSPGKFNCLFPDSVENSKFSCGEILVDLAALYKMSQIQYCNYDTGYSGITASFENTGIKKEKITKLCSLPSMTAALQTKAEGCINIGGYNIVRNGEPSYDWKNVVGENCHVGFSKVGRSRMLTEPFFQKKYYDAKYNGGNVNVLSARNGYIWFGCNEKLLKATLDEVLSMTDSNIFDSILVDGYTIKSIIRIDWLNNEVAFIGALGIRTNDNNQQTILIKANIANKTYKVVIKFPNTYETSTGRPSSYISNWCYSNYNNIIVYNDYGNQGMCGRVWVSENYGDSFRCIFKMFANSKIEETDNDAPVNPDLPWEQATAGDDLRYGNHVHCAVYDPYYDRIWVTYGDVAREDIKDTVFSALRWSDDWRNDTPTWKGRILDSNSLFDNCAIFGNKQMSEIVVLPECVLLYTDSGEEQGVFRVNRNNKDNLLINIDRAYLTGNRFSFFEATGKYAGICFEPGESSIIDGVVYTPFFSHEKEIFRKAAFILATSDGFEFTKIWEEDNEHLLSLSWGARIFDYDKDNIIVTKCAPTEDDDNYNNAFFVLGKGRFEL